MNTLTTLTAPTTSAVRRLGLAALAGAAALGLAACGGQDPAPAESSTVPSTAAASSAAGETTDASSHPAGASAGAASITVTDPWTKATEGEMTGSFGTITNTGEEDVHVVAVTSGAAPTAELHETVTGDDGQTHMQQAPDGFTIPAGESLELVPGGDHVMLMGLTAPIEAGEQVVYTLELEGGEEVEVTSVARPFTGANESYHGGEAEGGHADH